MSLKIPIEIELYCAQCGSRLKGKHLCIRGVRHGAAIDDQEFLNVLIRVQLCEYCEKAKEE